MNRECRFVSATNDRKRAIFIDEDNREEIWSYINQSPAHRNRFRYLAQIILENIRLPDAYDKEDINKQCKDVTAMKFFKGGSNDRIYCKEVRTPEQCYVVVMAVLNEKKKSQKNKAKENAKIEAVGSYEYSPKLPDKKS